MLYKFDTITASINVPPEVVWEYVANLSNWKNFSDFGKDIEHIEGDIWIFHTSQGDVKVINHFDKERLLLDQTCILASGEEQFIPYRVVPNGTGAELMMSIFKGSTSTEEEYKEQIHWAEVELNNVKQILEGAG